jgi:hypothetical protein
MNTIASSREGGFLSVGGVSECKQSSSFLRTISSASLAVWLGALPGVARRRHSLQASWLVFNRLV